MKAKRRHELQENSLANWVGEFIEEYRPYLIPLAIAVVAIPLVYFAVKFFIDRGYQQAGGSWAAYYAASANPDEKERYGQFRTVAENPELENSAAAAWAKQAMADRDLRLGSALLFSPVQRDDGIDQLQEAAAGYESILANTKIHPMLQRRAHYGLAQTYEALGEPKKAAQQYRILVEQAAETAIGENAKKRLSRLQTADGKGIRPSVVALFKGFENYEPSHAFNNMPVDISDLPEVPNLSFPGSDDFGVTTEDPKNTEEPTTDGAEPVADSSEPVENEGDPKTSDPKEPTNPEPKSGDPKETEPKETTDAVEPPESADSEEPATGDPATEPEEATDSATQE